MELRHIRYFLAVAEELHFGRAAKRLHIAQPPLSQQIRQLEEEMEVRLFARTSRSVKLTPEGELFLDEARRLLAGLDRAVDRTRDLARGKHGRLAVGFMGPASLSLLPEALRVFRRENPDVRLDLTTAASRDQLRMLRSGRMDVAFVHAQGREFEEFPSRLFLREPYVLVVPDGHFLAGRASVDIRELRDEPMIFYPRHLQPQLFDSFIASFREAGFSPKIVQESNSEQSTIALVATGLGCALVPDSSRRGHGRDVCFVPVRQALPSWEITMVWNRESEGPLLDRFLNVVEVFRRTDVVAPDHC
ncbi:LysR substrate-binding domain-containing protein [Pseudodesulfovibrio senegalensis]|jgi:DNA-binding transcriptional LysR family regulator|uniref:LysR family transcriptional regulator n=1 Tax=Pseudodesulfovibrio senegalensis TaxID=1721087 RepID=A0A6N6MYW2_9BACT|nr:LysR substrate-binding domain-containing protein [Pseudodesulfovibrio senegalensis]KAB1438816.1 LysR family transcriptional regulator [Pseudodesulfovibrio senegalensis]